MATVQSWLGHSRSCFAAEMGSSALFASSPEEKEVYSAGLLTLSCAGINCFQPEEKGLLCWALLQCFLRREMHGFCA
jgi:hypothetical protein